LPSGRTETNRRWAGKQQGTARVFTASAASGENPGAVGRRPLCGCPSRLWSKAGKANQKGVVRCRRSAARWRVPRRSPPLPPGDESPVRQQRPRLRPAHVTQRGSHACRARKVPGDPNWCPVLSNGLGRWHLSAVARRTQIAPLASDAEKQGECEWWRLARRPPLRAGRRARLNSGPLAGCRRQVLDHVDRGCSPLAR
jgi:hypothetical protein